MYFRQFKYLNLSTMLENKVIIIIIIIHHSHGRITSLPSLIIIIMSESHLHCRARRPVGHFV